MRSVKIIAIMYASFTITIIAFVSTAEAVVAKAATCPSSRRSAITMAFATSNSHVSIQPHQQQLLHHQHQKLLQGKWKRYQFVKVTAIAANCIEFLSSASPVDNSYDDNKNEVVSVDVTLMGSDYSRRRLFSILGAASMLAFSENAVADDVTTDHPWQKSIHPTSTIETSTSITASASSTNTDAVTVTATPLPPAIDTRAIIDKAAKKALGGGKAGAAAAVVQVLSLMWLRTSMNYQYRFGGTLSSSLKTLYDEGGISRLYQGLPFALIQGPLTRFGDTAANVGVLALLESIPETASLPLPLKTAMGSVSAGIWRIFLMPIDTSKTVMQVEGADGLNKLRERIMESGPSPLYQGALASAAATAAGHFPWFLTYNFLNEKLPAISKEDDLLLFLVRSAVLGLSASCVSDCVSNSLRVIKTTKQTASLGDNEKKEISYQEALALVLETDGVAGLLGRGLQTRLLTNAIQGALFSVLWKYFLVAT